MSCYQSIKKVRQFAFDENGNLVFVDHVKPGKKCHCTECNLQVFPKTGSIRIHHFAHNPVSKLSEKDKCIYAECVKNNEGYLHNIFKLILYDFLKEKIKQHEEFNIFYNAANLGQIKKNLLIKAFKIEKEIKIGPPIPDITIFDENGKPYIAIEIVVSNKPDQKKLAYYSENKITLFEIDLDKDDFSALEHVDIIASKPTLVSYIPDPKLDHFFPKSRTCKICGQPTYFSYLNIFKIECPDCKTKNRAAYISLEDENGENYKYKFNKYSSIVERNILDMHGLIYDKENFDFICSNENCNMPLSFNIHDITGKQTYPLAYYCQKCHRQKLRTHQHPEIIFQNKAEEKWAEYFDENGIEYEYIPQQFITPQNICISVFYLKEANEFVRACENFHSQEETIIEENKSYSLFCNTRNNVTMAFEDGTFYRIHDSLVSSCSKSYLVRCRKCKSYFFISDNDFIFSCKNCNYRRGKYTWDFELRGDEGF